MSERLTDKVAIRRALFEAISSEEYFIECWNENIEEPVVEQSKKNILAYRRVLVRYFGTDVHPMDELIKNSKTINIYDLMKDRNE